MQNLRDKLVKAGIVDKKTARQSRTEQRRERKRQGAAGSKAEAAEACAFLFCDRDGRERSLQLPADVIQGLHRGELAIVAVDEASGSGWAIVPAPPAASSGELEQRRILYWNEVARDA